MKGYFPGNRAKIPQPSQTVRPFRPSKHQKRSAQRPADEFVCPGCGQNIVSLPPQEPPPGRCATCLWLDQYITDPKERDAVRRWLGRER